MLRLKEKLCYGAGGFGNAVAGSMFLFFFSYFLTDVVKLAPVFVAVVQLFRNGWSAVNDPVVGSLTDRGRSRWGRRKPFILWAMLPYGATFALLWQHPPANAPWAIVAWLVVLVFLYDTASSLVTVPYLALTPELSPHYDERTALNAYRQAFSMVGGLVVGGTAEWLAGRAASPSSGWGGVGLLFGLFSALPFLAVVLGVKERRMPTEAAARDGMWRTFLSTLKNRPFRIALVVYLLSWVSVGVASTMFIYFLTHWMKMADQVGLVLLVVQLSALCSIPGMVWLSTRFGKRAAYLIGISFWAAVQLGLLMLGPEHGKWVVLLAACAGVGVGAAHVLPWAMIPDCIDVDELETGERREGAYYGVMSFMEKLGTALALGGVGLVLQLHGYDGAAVQATPSALWAVRLLMGPFPALLLVLSLIAALFYPLSRARHEAVRARLLARSSALVHAEEVGCPQVPVELDAGLRPGVSV